MQKKFVIGIDIGGTNLRIGAMNQENELVYFSKMSSRKIFENGNFIEELYSVITDFIKNNKIENVQAVAIGFPATLNKERTTVLNAPNIAGLDNLEVVNQLGNKLNIPVFIDKDVVMLFYNDLQKNNITQKGIIIGCYIGTGIGNVISINGEIIIGADGAAAELGHIPMLDKTDVCGCGNTGCLELYSGGKQLEKIIKENFPEEDIATIFETKAHEEVILKFIDTVAIPIVTEINILNPDLVLIGGGVLGMKGFPKDLLKKSIFKYARKPLPHDNLKLLFVEDEPNSGAKGAAIYAKEKLEAIL